MHIVFETPRLILARFTDADAPLIFRLNSNPEVLKYVHEPILKSETQASEVLNNIILPQYQLNLGRWAIYTKAAKEFIGWCGLKCITKEQETDLGYRLLPDAWGKGFATEAATHTLNYGFARLHLNEIIGKAHAENINSINVLQKTGMRYMKDIVEDNCPVKVYQAKLQAP